MSVTSSPRSRLALAAPAAVALVFAVAGAVQLRRGWIPYGDWAVAELVIRHVDRTLPLAGPYSAQRGYDHPLPLVYALQWIPYQLSGQRSAAGLATTVWWNGAWLTALVALTTRARAPWLGLAALATVPVMAARTEAGSLLLPWNPSLGLVPALVLVVVGWRVALGSRRLLPVMVGLAVWCAGAHLGYVPLVAVVVAAGAAGLVAVTVRRHGRGGLRLLTAPVAAAVGVAVVLASPMLVDLALHGAASNPATIVREGGPSSDSPRTPTSEVVKVVRAELAVPPAWADAEPPFNFIFVERAPRPPLLLPVVLLVGLAAWWRRAIDELVGIGLAAGALLGASAGLLNVDGALQPWYLLPAHAAGMALVAFTAWSGGRSAAAAAAHLRRGARFEVREPVRLGVRAAVATALAVAVVPSLRLQPHAPPIEEATEALTAIVVANFPPGTALTVDGPIAWDGYYTPALTLHLDRAGFDVRVPDAHTSMYTDAMAPPADWDATRLVLDLTAGPSTPPDPRARAVGTVPVESILLTGIDRATLWAVPAEG